MEDNKNWIAATIVSLGLLLVAVAIVLHPVGVPSVTIGGDTSNNPAPVVVSGTGQTQAPTFGAFGTNLDDETVFTRLRLESNARIGGDLSTSGTFRTMGDINSTSVQKILSRSWTGAVGTQGICSIQNTTGRPLVITDAKIQYATTTVTGGVANTFTISMGTAAATTGTGANLLTSVTVAVPTNGLTNLTVTSTLANATTTNAGNEMFGLPQLLQPNGFVNFMFGNPTSTQSGTCQLSYY